MAMATLKRHHSCSSSSSGSALLLPEELVIEILLRLPVKSVLRCTSICRRWHTIIRSQRFIRNHHVHHHQSNPTTGLLVYLVGTLYQPGAFLNGGLVINDVGGCSLFPPNDPKLQICEELDRGRVPGPIQSMCGPFNGILCVLRIDGTFALWNPATRGLRTVPPCPPLVPFKTDFGFGIDPLTDASKIVVIIGVVYI